MSAVTDDPKSASGGTSSDAVTEDLEEWSARARNAPAITTVHKNLRRRTRTLQATKKLLSSETWPNLLLTAPEEVRQLCMQHSLDLPPRSDAEVEHEAKRAKDWLVDVLRSHSQLLSRAQGLRTLRSGVEKELTGAQDRWSDMERLYMALTSDNVPEPEARLKLAFLVILKLNFANRLADVRQLATQRCAAIDRAASMDAKVNTVRTTIFDRMKDIKVDHFACAIQLKSLKVRPDIVDDNEGCCPICHNSYTDLSVNTPLELLEDFPVRIKYCGHIIGKGCLERWMSTPKIEEAKYPHRTCPLCRTKIEGVPGPKFPPDLQKHIRMDRRATETLKQLVDDWDVELEECLEAVVGCMSDEIACKELFDLMEKAPRETDQEFETKKKSLEDKLEGLQREKRAWGFRGDSAWRIVQDEWMGSGVVRRQ